LYRRHICNLYTK